MSELPESGAYPTPEPTLTKIEPGKKYRDGWGREHTVMGKALRSRNPDVEYHNIYWCDTGQWFREDGRARDGFGVINIPTNYDLKKEC